MNREEKEKKYESFNLYYLNLNKVYEISMMINNVVASSIEKESAAVQSIKKYRKVSVDGKIDYGYLASIKSVLESGNYSEKVSSSRMVEKLDIKTTKSILLKQIKNKAKEINNIDELDKCEEGELILLKDVKLSILDKKNLRQMLILKRDALKGLRVEGIEINNIINSVLKDYSYVLAGNFSDLESKNQFVIKIPFEIESEFENSYSIDDIVLGKVSIIGIYKNKNLMEDIANNTLNYFSNSDEEIFETKFFDSNKSEPTIEKNYDGIKESHYIDVVGIIQEIKFKSLPNKKVGLFAKIFRRNKNEK